MLFLTYLIVAVVALLIVYFDIFAIVDAVNGGRSTAVKAAWILFVIAMPVLGMILYFIFGRK